MSISLSNCRLHLKAFSDLPQKWHRRRERPSLEFTGTREAKDSATWEMLSYSGELSSPTLKATGHRCLSAQSQKTPTAPAASFSMKFPP